MSVRSIRKIETARTSPPQPPTVRLLADAFGLACADRDSFCTMAADEPADRVGGAVRPAQLPADLPTFVGRPAQLQALDELIAPDCQAARPGPFVISGTAGVGMTTLAVHWGHRVADQFPDGQLYVNLRGFDPVAG